MKLESKTVSVANGQEIEGKDEVPRHDEQQIVFEPFDHWTWAEHDNYLRVTAEHGKDTYSIQKLLNKRI